MADRETMMSEMRALAARLLDGEGDSIELAIELAERVEAYADAEVEERTREERSP